MYSEKATTKYEISKFSRLWKKSLYCNDVFFLRTGGAYYSDQSASLLLLVNLDQSEQSLEFYL